MLLCRQTLIKYSGGGYLDNAYKEQCKKIVDKGDKARQLLENWLKENDRRGSSAKRQSS